MNYSPILIVAGEPNSIFLEIFFKSLKLNKFKSPIILITSEKLLKRQMDKFNFKKKIRILNLKQLKNYKLNNDSINLINIKYQQKKVFEKISNKSNKFINESFSLAFKIIKKEKIFKFINGPISKKNFLNKKYPGITEFITQKFNVKNSCMLIYNKKLSVCPLTTHLPLRSVSKKINKISIIEKVKLINDFYRKQFKIKPHIAILGLNPHCESLYKFNEDEKIIKPAVNYLKNKKYLVSGPHSADTIFLNQNRKKYDVILGMYHDQVLTPIKTLFEYDAINITVGLPFIRISPDHGPNESMLGKNLSNPLSLTRAINFLDKN
tara:strand:+ start:215 stop:1180 length:966 start_codon:yes stop_codon:yes gene_type:complete